ncbi:TcpQ domain-containing protein [Alteromonas sp. a30]|uniref:TcpQ domain-containing protein n=1 Tax=Alteromonas sp. a30 TaxID=2730917 RepID=UPI00227E2188|nr:TcpQ domain-containing protein [Alteromonas sp. a30]MCY7295570.1 hypothetical protein [Alteromonas sp. a30]
MTVKRVSNAVFWARHIGLAAVLIIVAVVVISMQRSRDNEPQAADPSKPKEISANVSDFYSEYRQSSTKPIEEETSDFVMQLNDTDDQPLGARLKDMESTQTPVTGRWVGEHKFRTFEAGSTLRESITNFAQREGMQVIWELDQDFIVKDHFQMDDTIVGSLHKIARTVDSNFDGTVRAYICPRNRSLVITEKESDYLKTYCVLAGPSGD